MGNIRKLVAIEMRAVADRIETGATDITEDEATDIFGTIAHVALSKEDACSYLNLQRSQFDKMIREGRLPQGRKRRGHKELDWYKDELYLRRK